MPSFSKQCNEKADEDLGAQDAVDFAAILVAEVENPALRDRIQALRATVAA